MLKKYKHHLPHWNIEGAYYFITFKAYSGNFTLQEIEVILDIIRSGHTERYKLIAAQVMSNHVHLILQPNTGIPLSEVMRWIKGVTARRINQCRGKKGSIWMIDYFDRIIRSQSDLNEKLKYMYENPVRNELIEKPESYKGWYLLKE